MRLVTRAETCFCHFLKESCHTVYPYSIVAQNVDWLIGGELFTERLLSEVLEPVLRIRISFNADPDRAFYLNTLNADPDPDSGSQTNTDPYN